MNRGMGTETWGEGAGATRIGQRFHGAQQGMGAQLATVLGALSQMGRQGEAPGVMRI